MIKNWPQISQILHRLTQIFFKFKSNDKEFIFQPPMKSSESSVIFPVALKFLL